MRPAIWLIFNETIFQADRERDMFIRRNIGNRLIPTIIAVACLMKRACAVNEPRFAYVDFLRKRTGGPEPENFGTVYHD